MISPYRKKCSSNSRSSIARPRCIAALAALVALPLILPAASRASEAVAEAPLPPPVQRTLEQLRAAALADTRGYSIVEDLITRVGPRLAGSPAEARAREWAAGMLRAQGFANVRIEPFTVDAWEPLVETAAILGNAAQPLVVTGIGGSPSTPAGGVSGEVVRFESLAALEAAPRASVQGRIVFIDEGMTRTQDGDGYGVATVRRRGCQQAARAQGALACLIRSVGTNTDRFAHQGWGSTAPPETLAPTAALAPTDAATLARLLARSREPVRVQLNLQTRSTRGAPSGNVIAEVTGRESPQLFVLAAAHLDSWSLGQGAIDDGAGVAIITAAAKLISDLPVKPRRSIRLLLAGAEESGGWGGLAYRDAHQNEQHVAAAESDAGDGRIWRVRTGFGAGALPQQRALQRALAPLGILPGANDLGHGGGTDIEPTVRTGVPAIELNQDVTRYFDVHHTANDTLERIVPDDLRQNIAAWAVTLYLLAEMDWNPAAK